MKKVLFAAVAAVLSVCAEPVKHVLVLGDESRGFIHYRDEFNPENDFSLQSPRPVWDLKWHADGQVRAVAGKGFTVTDIQKRAVVDRFEDNRLGGVSSVEFLPDGGFLAGTNQKENGTNAIVVYAFAKDRSFVSRTAFPQVSNLRQMTRLANGELLLAYEKGMARVTLADGGKVLQLVAQPKGRNSYKAIVRKAGGYWLSAGYAQELYALSEAGVVEKTFSVKMPDGLHSHFFGGVTEQANGNLMVANWTGHGADDSKKGWQAIEFAPDGSVVWHLWDPAKYGSISGVLPVK